MADHNPSSGGVIDRRRPMARLPSADPTGDLDGHAIYYYRHPDDDTADLYARTSQPNSDPDEYAHSDQYPQCCTD